MTRTRKVFPGKRTHLYRECMQVKRESMMLQKKKKKGRSPVWLKHGEGKTRRSVEEHTPGERAGVNYRVVFILKSVEGL